MAATATVPTNNTNTQTTVAGGGPSAGQKVNTSEVGWLFVHEYYTFLNKEPSRLHCFYGAKSTLIHGNEGEQVKSFQGEKEIQKKIQELDLENCRVLVTNVDSQASIDGGIVIQVLGEMSNRGEPSRKFAQTFFLAVQPNGYFVLNDIIRFLKDDDEVYEETDEVETEIPSTNEEIVTNDEEINSNSPSGTLVEEPINNRSVTVTEMTSIFESVELNQIPPPTDATNDVTVNGANGIEVKDESQVVIEVKEELNESVQPSQSEVKYSAAPQSSSVTIDNVTKVDQPKPSSHEIPRAVPTVTNVKPAVNSQTSQVVPSKPIENVPSQSAPSPTAPDRLSSPKPVAANAPPTSTTTTTTTTTITTTTIPPPTTTAVNKGISPSASAINVSATNPEGIPKPVTDQSSSTTKPSQPIVNQSSNMSTVSNKPIVNHVENQTIGRPSGQTPRSFNVGSNEQLTGKQQPPPNNQNSRSPNGQAYGPKSTPSVSNNGQSNQSPRNVGSQNATPQRESSPIGSIPTTQNSITPVVNGHGQRSNSPVENALTTKNVNSSNGSDQNIPTKQVNGQPTTVEINTHGPDVQKNTQVQVVSNQANQTGNAVTQSPAPSQQANTQQPQKQQSGQFTWANLAANEHNKWEMSNALADTKGHVTSVTAPVQKTQQKSASQQQRQHMRDNRDNQDRRQDGNRNNRRNSDTSLSIYVRGITQAMTRESLHNAFKAFGYVSHIDVVYSKSCAFVEYNNADSYKAALNAHTIKIGNESVSTEERRGHNRRNNNKPQRGRY